MKYLLLVLANFRRRKVRTALTIGSFMVAIFLFGLLATIRGAFGQGETIAGVNRLTIINKISLIMPLPMSYRERLQQVDGVAGVTYATWFGGIYQDESNFFPQFAIDHETYIDIFPEYVLSPEERAEFGRDREGCIVGQKLASRFNWQVGDRIPLRGTIFSGTWEFNICGIYQGKRKEDDTSQFWFRHDYLDERRPWGKGLVGWYTVELADPDHAVDITENIDTLFANSPWETLTQTEKAFAAAFANQMGNIELLLISIGSVVFFTLMLVTGNTMAIAVRERTNELAVLKALGYSNPAILGLVLAESLTIAIVGGGIGLAAAKIFTLGGDPTGGMLPFFYLPASALVTGTGLILVIGVLSGLLPAISAMRLKVVDALRRI